MEFIFLGLCTFYKKARAHIPNMGCGTDPTIMSETQSLTLSQPVSGCHVVK